MISIFKQTCYLARVADQQLGKFHSPAAILARLYIANVFFSAGLTKLRDWDTTLFLFEEEYHVPFLPFELAAYLGTFAEIAFPIFLALGLLTKFSALGLFAVNIVAVLSLSEVPAAAFNMHVVWALLLAQLAIYGGGFFSLDRLLPRFVQLKNSHSPIQI